MFVSFEGVDGSGKSTQARLLVEHLEQDPDFGQVLFVREPGGTPAAERMREILIDGEVELAPMSELMLFEAARADLLARVVRPALAAGTTVICDRFTDSTLAYQGRGRELGFDRVGALNELATEGLAPCLTFYLRIDPEIALERIDGGDRFENVEFLREVTLGYDQIASAAPDRVVTLDATDSPEQIHLSVRERVERLRLPGRR